MAKSNIIPFSIGRQSQQRSSMAWQAKKNRHQSQAIKGEITIIVNCSVYRINPFFYSMPHRYQGSSAFTPYRASVGVDWQLTIV